MAKYSLDPISANCYPNTTVLINKLGITDEQLLDEAEAEITGQRILRWNSKPQSDTFDFAHYKEIHKFLFEELYDWAGQIRDVNISKKGTRFCPFDEIESRAKRIFTRLKKNDYLQDLQKKEFVEEFIDIYEATNMLHPFREGNGRTQRAFLTQLAHRDGWILNFADIDVDELMIATMQSAQGVTDRLRRVFSVAINKPSIIDELQRNVERSHRQSSPPKRSRNKAERDIED
jgi:cell filamentation protein